MHIIINSNIIIIAITFRTMWRAQVGHIVQTVRLVSLSMRHGESCPDPLVEFPDLITVPFYMVIEFAIPHCVAGSIDRIGRTAYSNRNFVCRTERWFMISGCKRVIHPMDGHSTKLSLACMTAFVGRHVWKSTTGMASCREQSSVRWASRIYELHTADWRNGKRMKRVCT